MNTALFVKNMAKWQSETWHIYACYTHEGGSRLEANGLGKWRVIRNGELVRTTNSAEVAAQTYLGLMPSKLQKEF